MVSRFAALSAITTRGAATFDEHGRCCPAKCAMECLTILAVAKGGVDDRAAACRRFGGGEPPELRVHTQVGFRRVVAGSSVIDGTDPSEALASYVGAQMLKPACVSKRLSQHGLADSWHSADDNYKRQSGTPRKPLGDGEKIASDRKVHDCETGLVAAYCAARNSATFARINARWHA